MSDLEQPLPIPEFAVVGHPNEGKSSVVSTLTENDAIGISPVPGETTVSGTYTVEIHGREIIRFVDTPGFQTPRQTLDWFRKYTGPADQMVETFINTFKSDPFFCDECELLGPVARGAGIIYVVDGSRPVRPDDLAEMEILRLTGRPRMAVINAKGGGADHVAEWRREFGMHFNAIRVFNSNTADFGERIRMLESLKSMDQNWEPALERVILAFRTDWEQRNRTACNLILHGVEKSLAFSLSRRLDSSGDEARIREKLTRDYAGELRGMEAALFEQIRRLYRHTLFQVDLPGDTLLRHDLFSKKTWALLGLTPGQLAAAGAVMGGSMGVVADVAAHGLSFGVFTTLGGIIGAGSAVWGGRRFAAESALGRRLGGDRVQVGPSKDLQFFFILLDRALLYYGLVMARPHGRRDDAPVSGDQGKQGITSRLSREDRKICTRYFNAVIRGKGWKKKEIRLAFENLLAKLLTDIADPAVSGGLSRP